MNVLFISSMYHKPGRSYAGDRIHRLAVELGRAGVEIRVICPVPRFDRSRKGPGRASSPVARAPLPRTLTADGVPITYLRFPNLPLGVLPGAHAAILRAYLRDAVARLRSDFAFELIHAHRLFATGFAALEVARGLDVPAVVSAVGSDVHSHPERNRGIRERTARTIRGSAAVVSVSHALARQIEALAEPAHPVCVVYRGVDADRFVPSADARALRARLGLPIEGVGLCTVGNLLKAKGMLDLVASFRSIARDFPRAWLSIVGEGPLRPELEARIETFGLEDRVFLPGSQPHAEVADWIAAADVFVLASHNEGLPNVVLEAMACARPVVATRVGGIPEAVEDGVSGLLVPARDVNALEGALRRMIRTEAKLEMGRAGRERVGSRFTWERSAQDTLDVYREVLARRSRGTPKRPRNATSRPRAAADARTDPEYGEPSA